jgi:hypothetical protein
MPIGVAAIAGKNVVRYRYSVAAVSVEHLSDPLLCYVYRTTVNVP